MRNTWKGMMLGALSGALVGLVLDSLDRAAQGAGNAVHAAPDAAAWAGRGAKERAFSSSRLRRTCAARHAQGGRSRRPRPSAERTFRRPPAG